MKRWTQVPTDMRAHDHDWVESPHGQWVTVKDAYATADKLAGLLNEAYQMMQVMVATNNDFGSPKMDPFRGAADGEGSTLDRVRKALASHTQEMCWGKS
jgi:hypothetical protein